MLAGGTDSLYRNVLSRSHRHYGRLEVWSNGQLLETLIPQEISGEEGGIAYSDASVVASLNSRVSRNLSFRTSSDLIDLMNPFANEIRAFSGVLLGDGSDQYVWQCFRGRVTTVSDDSDGMCEVFCADRGQEVVDVNFIAPENSQTLNTVSDEFVRLVSDALADATFGASDSFVKSVEAMTWEFNRGSGLDEMAKSVGALWYALANGDFVLRRFPWTVDAEPVVTLAEGDSGSVLRWRRTRDRLSIFNIVTVTGERLNGDVPVYATAQDTTGGSLTNVNGSFGRRSILERQQTPSTQGGAQSAAEELLKTYVPTEEWSLQMVPDAAMELGDVVRLQLGGLDTVQVVTSIALPLDLSASMSVSTRSLVTGSA